jgi:predicted HicB family RNase H-like nuclease
MQSRKQKHKVDAYQYVVTWSEEDQVFIGRVTEFPSLGAHGDTLEAALREIETVVKLVLADLSKSNEPIPEPLSTRRFSGKFNVRVPANLHRRLAAEAAREGVSLNELVNHKLES